MSLLAIMRLDDSVMLRRYLIIINLLLIILSLFLVNKVYKIWKLNEYQDLSRLTKENQTTFSGPKLSDPKKLPRKEYQVIVNKDLFRPERTEWQPPSQKEQNTVVSKTTLQLRLYGIVISDDFKYAWIKEEGRKEKMKKISEGEPLNDWKVITIEPNSISLIRGEETVKYNLIEQGKPKKRTPTKSLTPKKSRPKKPPKPKKIKNKK